MKDTKAHAQNLDDANSLKFRRGVGVVSSQIMKPNSPAIESNIHMVIPSEYQPSRGPFVTPTIKLITNTNKRENPSQSNRKASRFGSFAGSAKIAQIEAT